MFLTDLTKKENVLKVLVNRDLVVEGQVGVRMRIIGKDRREYKQRRGKFS
jgi:hypothetical protein